MTLRLFGTPSFRVSIMYMVLCWGVVKCFLTRRGGSKIFNMNHSRRSGLSDSELPGKSCGKITQHVFQCASVSRDITPTVRVPLIDSLPWILSFSPSVNTLWYIFFFGFESILLARQVLQERTQMEVIRKPGWLAVALMLLYACMCVKSEEDSS